MKAITRSAGADNVYEQNILSTYCVPAAFVRMRARLFLIVVPESTAHT